jgi:putative flippase GtrA
MKSPIIPPVIARFVRSGIAGGLATVVDLAMLTGLVSLGGVSPRVASIPALIAGGIAAFIAQKLYAFRAPGGRVVQQAAQFVVVQVGSVLLTGLLFDRVVRWGSAFASHYVIVRLGTSNIVWLGFSFPLWHFVFRRPAGAAAGVDAE